jgi:hypothetical protein
MYKKIVGILIMTLFIGTSFCSSFSSLKDEELDQYQTGDSYAFVGTTGWAQSFKPTLNTLSRVEVNLYRKPSSTVDLTVSIRPSIDGIILTSVTIPINTIPTSADWINFDFPDISVTPEQTYFIQAEGDSGLQVSYSQGNPYTRGDLYLYYIYTMSWFIHDGDLTFKTYGYNQGNNPPDTPRNPNPSFHETDVKVNSDLSWLGGDPDIEDIVTYDIYFGTNSNPPLNKSGYPTTSYDPGTMNINTKYYWKIVAIDNHGATTTGPVWDFTTSSIENQLPNITIISPEEKDIVKDIVNIYGIASDPDGNETLNGVELRIDDKPWENASGTEYWNYSWNTVNETEGTHTIKARSYDGELYSNYSLVNVTVQHDKPDIVIIDVNGGFSLKVDISNIGNAPGYDMNWSIDVEASIGIVLSGEYTEGTIDELDVNETVNIQSKDLRGIGLITITVQAADAKKQATAFLLGPLVLRVNEL